MAKKIPKLTPLVIAFVDNYLKANRVNATKALVDAGYADGRRNGKCKNSASTYASRLLSDPDIQKYIAKRSKQIADAFQITPEWVISMAKRNAEKAMKGYPVYDKEGNELYIKVDHSGVNGALTVIAKVLGLEKTAVEHSIKNDGFGLVLHMDNSEAKKDERQD